MKVANGQQLGIERPHLGSAEEIRSCREHGRAYFCDVVSEPTIDLPAGTLVMVIDQLELRQRVTGGFGQVTWYQVEAVNADGTLRTGTGGNPIVGWAMSTVFSPVSR